MTDGKLIALGQRLTEAAFIGTKSGKPKPPEGLDQERLQKTEQPGGVKKKRMNSRAETLVRKSTGALVKKLRELAAFNTNQTGTAMNAETTLEWRYADKVTLRETQLLFATHRTADGAFFENKAANIAFEVFPDRQAIDLILFYYPQVSGEVKKTYPPYMTMYFLQAYADSVGYTIVVPDDDSDVSNAGASYYASNYGFRPLDARVPYFNLTRAPCPEDLKQWIGKRCRDTLEECFQNAEQDRKLDELKTSSCWTETKDSLFNFGSSAARDRKNEGYAMIDYRGHANSLYTGEVTNFRMEGEGTVITPDGLWVYTGGFWDGKLHGYGVETGPNGFRREGFWDAGEPILIAPDIIDIDTFMSEL